MDADQPDDSSSGPARRNARYLQLEYGATAMSAFPPWHQIITCCCAPTRSARRVGPRDMPRRPGVLKLRRSRQPHAQLNELTAVHAPEGKRTLRC
jgi:hypothetical protein